MLGVYYGNGYKIADNRSRDEAFQQKGFKGVGLNKIIKACNISKGSLYHFHKEELLITCLQSLNEEITKDIVVNFRSVSDDARSYKRNDFKTS